MSHISCLVCVQSVFVEPPQPATSLLSMAESQTRLPCRYQVEAGEKVVQVTWYKDLPDGSKDMIITAHFTDGRKEFGRYAGLVRFEGGTPTENSALLIPSTEESDEGSYTCHISTFPNGNFERQISLTVWILPISSLEPVLLVEGQSFRLAASCRAVGRPPPRLSWDTDLPGQSSNRTTAGGSVSSYYSLHPLRSMNGKKLDCLVWHPGLEQPRRLSNSLVVQYPPDVTISAGTDDWFAGLERAELMCGSGGNPKPDNITWTRRGGALPDGVSVIGGRLVFGRALLLNDSGVYECVARNNVGKGKTENPRISLLIIIGASAGALVMVLIIVVLLVNRYHRLRNEKLERQLSEKTEEMNSFSRQASLRRINSVSTDPRVPVHTHTHTHTHTCTHTDTLQGLHNKVDTPAPKPGLARVEPQACQQPKNQTQASNVSIFLLYQDSGLPSSLVPLKAQQEDGIEPREPELAHPREGESPPEEEWVNIQPPEEERDDGDDEDSSSYQISEALTNHFYYSNGVLRPRPHSNAILTDSYPKHERGREKSVCIPAQRPQCTAVVLCAQRPQWVTYPKTSRTLIIFHLSFLSSQTLSNHLKL
uniref:Nectin cell adhesion molecule 4b n=1 Tax=Labrus bergylta TaxID=56723 RepID=A0A3Q3EHQ5_9LABR